MKLSELFYGGGEVEISSIASQVGKVMPGALFVLKNSASERSETLLREAGERGAVAVLTDGDISCNLPIFVTADLPKEVARISSQLYGYPEDKMKIIAVTGTNGKTTVTRIVWALLTALGKRAGVIGTLGAEWCGKRVDTGLTTPGRIELENILFNMQSDGVEYVAIEVSAHGIEQGRMQGITADVGIFTNFSQDHLDYFKTMDSYANVKRSYFDLEKVRTAVINVDDELGRKILSDERVPSLTYGLDNPSDVFAIDVKLDSGTELVLNACDEIFSVKSTLSGRFNVYNLLASFTALRVLGFNGADVVRAFKSVAPIPGRFEVIRHKKGRVVIDFAHTPDALENILKSLKNEGYGRLICVFGCGGNRDYKKRPLMGAIAEKYSDVVILTSDNPRFEDPREIIADVKRGIKGEFKEIISRRDAVAYALEISSNDTVLLAGKGAEEYTETCGEKIYGSDRELVNELIEEKGL